MLKYCNDLGLSHRDHFFVSFDPQCPFSERYALTFTLIRPLNPLYSSEETGVLSKAGLTKQGAHLGENPAHFKGHK